jgi:hypothetical protein
MPFSYGKGKSWNVHVTKHHVMKAQSVTRQNRMISVRIWVKNPTTHRTYAQSLWKEWSEQRSQLPTGISILAINPQLDGYFTHWPILTHYIYSVQFKTESTLHIRSSFVVKLGVENCQYWEDI